MMFNVGGKYDWSLVDSEGQVWIKSKTIFNDYKKDSDNDTK